MSGDTARPAPRRHNVAKIRCHDYLYDSAFVVSGARDYARTAFKAAMASAQVVLQPVYNCMFSDMKTRPRMHVVYHPNCRLPDHIDRSYGGYLNRQEFARKEIPLDLCGKDEFKFTSAPKKVLSLPSTTPDFHPPSPSYQPVGSTKPRNRATQSLFRESSAQTIPWQPDGKAAEQCETTPEMLYLDKLEWGPGKPYRRGDLPADFHTTAIINKMRHARAWMSLVERGKFPRWMKNREAIITDVETKDWLFREAEIDELQHIRLELLHRLQSEQRGKQTSRTSLKLAKLWATKKQEMDTKVDNIRKTRDRELRKLIALHEGGGRAGLVERLKFSRGGGCIVTASQDPTSDLHAPLARHGYQARRRHAKISYDPSLLSLEDHKELSAPPPWLEKCGQDLKKSCSGHHLPRNPNELCERETKWSEQYLENLHNDLIKARLGAAKMTAGPLHVLKPRKDPVVERPTTPEVEAVEDFDESSYQFALVLERIIRGRAVQVLMYEGRTRASELTEELKTTHGLQKEDKARIANEEAKAREFNARRTEIEQKEDAISALVDELSGGAVSAALDFLEKELGRLKQERRQHAFLLIALREKTMREAAEAGRRQKEEHRRREHDEMFKQVLGVTQGTVDAYLKEVISEGIELAAEAAATKMARAQADKYDENLIQTSENLTTADTNELVAELVQQFLLPHTHKTATRHHIQMVQGVKLEAARRTIFGLIDDAEVKDKICTRCGGPLDENCRCHACPIEVEPTATTSRDDWRWKYTRMRPPTTNMVEKIPMEHEVRYMLRDMVCDVVKTSRSARADALEKRRAFKDIIEERMEIVLDCRHIINVAMEVAIGAMQEPIPKKDYYHYMKRVFKDVQSDIEPKLGPCPKELPPEIRRRRDELLVATDPRCHCDIKTASPEASTSEPSLGQLTTEEKRKLLPSQLRVLEDLRKCKCDLSPTVTTEEDYEAEEGSTVYSRVTTPYTHTEEEGEYEGESN